MRVLVISNVARSLLRFRGDLIQEMISAGHEVHVVSPDFDTAPEIVSVFRSWSVVMHSVPMSRAGLTPLGDLRLFFALGAVMRAIRPACVFGYTAKPVIYGTLAGKLTGVPRRFAMVNGLGYAFTGKAHGKRKIARLALKLLYRLSLKHAACIFFQNSDDLDDLRRNNVIGSDAHVMVVNGSGINVNEYPPAAMPDPPMTFLLVARLLTDKGIREYAAAAKQIRQDFPDTQFHLVGSFDRNPTSITPEEVARWSAAGDVVHHGYLEDVRPALAACHVFVFPSYYREGTPRSILEALSTGRAVITTNAPGCRETVVEGYNGFLVEPRSAETLSEVIKRFILDPSLVSVQGKNARALAVEKYNVDLVNAVMLQEMGLNE